MKQMSNTLSFKVLKPLKRTKLMAYIHASYAKFNADSESCWHSILDQTGRISSIIKAIFVNNQLKPIAMSKIAVTSEPFIIVATMSNFKMILLAFMSLTFT
jgi:hypothetical protein